MNINLHIDRLVLDGVNIPPSQHRLLKTSVQAELSRLLAKDGISPYLASGGTTRSISAKGIQLGSGKGSSNNPVQLGRQIARSVYGGTEK